LLLRLTVVLALNSCSWAQRSFFLLFLQRSSGYCWRMRQARERNALLSRTDWQGPRQAQASHLGKPGAKGDRCGGLWHERRRANDNRLGKRLGDGPLPAEDTTPGAAEADQPAAAVARRSSSAMLAADRIACSLMFRPASVAARRPRRITSTRSASCTTSSRSGAVPGRAAGVSRGCPPWRRHRRRG